MYSRHDHLLIPRLLVTATTAPFRRLNQRANGRGTVVTGKFGVAIQEGVDTRQVWLTRDSGRRWTSVTVH
jgi:hypothetical protein